MMMKATTSSLVSMILQSSFVLLALQSVAAFTTLQPTINSVHLSQARDAESSSTCLSMATWSDSRAVRDYQDFLSSGKQEIELAKDNGAVIVQPAEGPNPLAHCLKEMGADHCSDVVVTPAQDLPATVGGQAEYPIYVTLPPTQLNDFLQNLRESYKERMDDFVFISGGMDYGNIEDVLKERGYCRDHMTQVLISGIRIAPNGRPQDLSVNLGLDSQGEPKMANECAACGKWSGAVAERLGRFQIPCATDFYREWRRKMWERHVLDACFHLLGVVRDQQPTTLADVAKYYDAEASDMVWEMSQLLRGWRAITLMFGFEERIFGTAEMQGTEVQCTLSDEMYPYLWGNQVFLQSKMFCEYLTYAKQEKGCLPNTDIPERADEDFKSRMRQGNLRADGVI